MIVKTRALVLRDIKYRDQSKICLLLTREYGQVSVILKGGRSAKSRTGPLFSPGNVIEAVLYKKGNRDIQLLSDASLVLSPLSESPDLERFSVLYRVLDLVRYASTHEEKNVPLFTIAHSAIWRLCHAERNFQTILAWFLLRLVGVLGFAPSLDRCVFSNADLASSIEEMKLDELFFVLDPGGFALPGSSVPMGAAIQRVPASRYRFIRALDATGNALCPEAPPDEVAAVTAMLQEYCARHLDRMPHRKHLEIVSRLISA
ncbi:DNA repair protein RecO [Chlorobaculum thiosulfatiphilum]|uniref:DNA repair protein RecO n=1 Tax=Chlorobaculum thiosulfatiphilum TaxID=115852 RepID=A0A5C4S2G9_CHLTI|nr:DNA repair protein RecO [Chlorobaculum thiosulfatiphilum]TNJ37525.1 DNA repair protein RecO [Chlorobaculum thiosulfatiphilum]